MAKTIDIFTYNGEADLLEIHLSIMDKFVDEFIIVESPTTFSGLQKPLYFSGQKERFAKWIDKITYFINDEKYTTEEIEQARISPFTNGEERWMREWLQKESLKKALIHLKNKDIVIIGDVDEVVNIPWIDIEHMRTYGTPPTKFKLKVYAYWLNFVSTEQFWGTVIARYDKIKDECFNDIRNTAHKTGTGIDYGWHFTNMGGYESVKKKIEDQYNEQFFNNTLIKDILPQTFGTKDYIGRDFILDKDESELPLYLLENKEKYTYLWKF